MRELETMATIQAQKAKDIAQEDEHDQLDPEHAAKAKHKRFTLDVADTPSDPLR